MERKDPDVDGGFAWVVLAGCFVMYLFTVGSVKSYGILYTEMVDYFHSGSGNTAWIGSLALFLLLGLGPFANFLSQKFTFRQVCFVGGLFLGGGFIASAFVSRVVYLYLTYGIICGFGYGLIFSPCSTIISFYFVKRRALANGVIVSASGVGALGFPLIYKYLIETLTLKGTLWLVGGILLNVCAAACILRQPKLLRNKIKKEQNPNDHVRKALLNDESLVQHDDKPKRDNTKMCRGCDLFKFSLFKNPVFTMYAIAFTFCQYGYGSNTILIPSHTRALGYDKTYEALSVSIMGCAEVFARIFFGWFTDLNVVKRKYIFQFSMLISAVFCFMAPFFDSFVFVGIYAAVIGIFPGSFWSLIAVMVIEVVGLKDFSASFGLISLCLAFGTITSQPSIGWLKDYTGNWNASFICIGCMFVMAGLITVLEPMLVRFCVQPKSVELDSKNSTHIPLRVRTDSEASVTGDLESVIKVDQTDVTVIQ